MNCSFYHLKSDIFGSIMTNMDPCETTFVHTGRREGYGRNRSEFFGTQEVPKVGEAMVRHNQPVRVQAVSEAVPKGGKRWFGGRVGDRR